VTVCSLLLFYSSDSRLFAWCVVGFCAGIYLFIHGFFLLQRRRLILDTPASKIRSASMGMVEVNGLAVGPYTMIAPITSRSCYYYRTLVWEWKRRGRSSQWVKVASECMHLPFFLDDNTGQVMVDPRGAELDLHRDFQQEFCDGFFTTKEPAPDNVHSFLVRHGIVTSSKIKVEEFCIKPKNSLFILGTLAENPGLEVSDQPLRDADNNTSSTGSMFSLSLGGTALSFGGESSGDLDEPAFADRVQNAQPEVIRLSTNSGPMRAADMTQQQKVAAALARAGITSPAAWAAAGMMDSAVRVEAAPKSGNEGGPQSSSGNGFDPHPAVVLTKGTNNKTFLISWRSQQDLASSLGWKCTLMIWGGPALSLLCLYFLLNLMYRI
jgi:hypothetical protein